MFLKQKLLKLVGVNLLILIGLSALTIGVYELNLRHKVTNGDGPAATVLVPVFEADEKLTWVHKQNHKYDYLGEEGEMNKFGHRDLYFPDAEKQILMLGDSFVFGMNVNDGLTIADYLQSKLDKAKWDVMNAGVIGYTIDQQLLYLTENFEELDPELVVLTIFVGNDLTEQRRHKVERNADGYPVKVDDQEVFVTDGGYLGSRNKVLWNSLAISDIRKRWRSFERRFKPFAGLTWSAFLRDTHEAYPSDMEKLWSSYLADLRRMQDYLDGKDVPLLVALMPMDVQVNKDYWDKYPQRVFDEQEFEDKIPQQRFLHNCEQEGYDCLDLLPEFQRFDQEAGLYFEHADPHLTAAGSELSAELLFAKLRTMLQN